MVMSIFTASVSVYQFPVALINVCFLLPALYLNILKKSADGPFKFWVYSILVLLWVLMVFFFLFEARF